MSMLELNVSRAEDVFRNVIALYSALNENRRNLRPRRVELNMNGEVTAEPLDFLLDCEKKARAVLTPRQYTFFTVFTNGGFGERLSADIQIALGTKWRETDLDIDGPYRSLYFRVKNASDREMLKNGTSSNNDNSNRDTDDFFRDESSGLDEDFDAETTGSAS